MGALHYMTMHKCNACDLFNKNSDTNQVNCIDVGNEEVKKILINLCIIGE